MSGVIYPISFDNGTCPHCAAKGYMKYYDKNNHQTNFDYYPVSIIECTKCKTEFFLRWYKDEESDEYHCYPISFSNINDFEKDIIEFTKDKERDISLEKYYEYNQLLKPIINNGGIE